jgi:hypothetical protein
MFSRLIVAIAIALFFSPAALIVAQEHPEHPKKGAEHPKKGTEAKQVSTADISAGIKTNIETESKKSSDGKFHVKHEGQDLALDLIRVHDDRLSDLGGGKYFACVDMKGTDGKTYDIDFFLTGQPGKMKVTETSVHKIDGKPLYNWKEESGKWLNRDQPAFLPRKNDDQATNGLCRRSRRFSGQRAYGSCCQRGRHYQRC